jgi:hypothetical protein
MAASNGDVIFSVRRPLAAEIANPPFLIAEKLPIIRKRLQLERKLVQNTNMKPWYAVQMVTSLPVSDAP